MSQEFINLILQNNTPLIKTMDITQLVNIPYEGVYPLEYTWRYYFLKYDACDRTNDIINNYCEILELFLNKGVNVNQLLIHNMTLLHCQSLYHPDPRIIKLLLDYGADPNIESPIGDNALCYFFRPYENSLVIPRMLCKAGAKLIHHKFDQIMINNLPFGNYDKILFMISKGANLPFNWRNYVVGVEMFNLLTKVENHGFREDFKIIVKRIIFLLRVYKTFLSEKLCFPDNVSQLIVSFLFLNFTKNTSNA